MGSGKSTILKKVKKSGIKVIDCDYEIHQIINSNKNFHLFLKDLFVNLDYCDKAGIPDRQKIATIIFDTNIKSNDLSSKISVDGNFLQRAYDFIWYDKTNKLD